jgi:hypothetical protein
MREHGNPPHRSHSAGERAVGGGNQHATARVARLLPFGLVIAPTAPALEVSALIME